MVYSFIYFRFTRVKLKIYSPWYHSEAKAGNGIQLYIYIYILSLYVVSHLELSKWTGQSCFVNCKFLYDFIMLLLLLLLLCITRQHIYVVVVVVIVYVYWSFVSISRNTRALFFK